MTMTAMVVATAHIKNPIDVEKNYIHTETSEICLVFYSFLDLLFLRSTVKATHRIDMLMRDNEM